MPHADPVERQRYNREYKRANRWRYRQRQKAYDAARHANERAAEFGRPGILTPEDVEELFAIGCCHYCGAAGELSVDHRVGLHDPASTNTPDNTVPACPPCNRSKMRADRPWRWSRTHECCIECGGTSKRHVAGGRCSPCYWREYERTHPGRKAAV